MRFLILLSTVLLTACGSGGGSEASGSETPATPVDTTPRDYVAGYTVMGDYGLAHNATMRQVCNLNLSGFRDETTSHSVFNSGEQAKIGCGGVSNYTIDVTNTGSVDLYFNVSIDGVYRPEFDHVIAPGQTYTFQRGF